MSLARFLELTRSSQTGRARTPRWSAKTESSQPGRDSLSPQLEQPRRHGQGARVMWLARISPVKVGPESLPGPYSATRNRSRGAPGVTSGLEEVPETRSGTVPQATQDNPEGAPRPPRSAPWTPRECPGDLFVARQHEKSGSSAPSYVRLARQARTKRLFDDFCMIFGWSARGWTVTKYCACQ